MSLELLRQVTATNGKPSAATDGKPIRAGQEGQLPDQGFRDWHTRAMLLVWSDAGSGTMDVTIRLWGYLKEYRKGPASTDVVSVGKWFPLGPGTDSLKGTFNDQAAAGETNTNEITHEEPIAYFGTFDRLYAEVVAINGTDTRVTVIIVPLRSQEA